MALGGGEGGVSLARNQNLATFWDFLWHLLQLDISMLNTLQYLLISCVNIFIKKYFQNV
jgi:hypothetical protein